MQLSLWDFLHHQSNLSSVIIIKLKMADNIEKTKSTVDRQKNHISTSTYSGLSISEKLSLTTILVGIITFSLGLFFNYFIEKLRIERVEEPKQLFDSTKTSIDVSKFLNDLRPKVENECITKTISNKKLEVSCRLKNIGSHRVLINEPKAVLSIRDTDDSIDKTSFNQKHQSPNALPTGIEGLSDYSIEFDKAVDWNKITVESVFISETDSTIIKIAKKMFTKNNISAQDIDSLSQQNYRFRSFPENFEEPDSEASSS
jgi:hypothetical protein